MTNRRAFLLLLAAMASPSAALAGAWSYESFENDGALDWAGEFVDNPTPAFVRQSLALAVSGKYIDNFAGECTIAAAEVVAASLGRPCKVFPKELAPIVAKARSEIRALSPLAKSALARVLGPQSELRQNWSVHADDLAKWEASVHELQARLSQSVA